MKEIINNNRLWSKSVKTDSPDFFTKLSMGQSPPYLWIGCSDSRVPASLVCGLKPGELFVHRNIANLVNPEDTSLQSVIQYSVAVLKVKHIILCGHTGCGGVKASIEKNTTDPIRGWLKNLEDTYEKYQDELESLPKVSEEQVNRLVELNVREQVNHLKENSVVQSAWKQGQDLAIHGLIYDLKTGELEDVGVTLKAPQ